MHKLKDNAEILFVLHSLNKPDNIGVVNHLIDVQLISQHFNIFVIQKLSTNKDYSACFILLFDEFDCYSGICLPILGFTHVT